jgi:prepilin-type N-terminal cleavage/methylation domain-containing protein
MFKQNLKMAAGLAGRAGLRRVQSSRCPRSPGFTLIEILVVTAVSLLLMMAGTFVYVNCMKLYRESRETTEVLGVARIIDEDMRDLLGSVVPIRGCWINPQTLWMGGGSLGTSQVSSSGNLPSYTLSNKYVSWTQSMGANHTMTFPQIIGDNNSPVYNFCVNNGWLNGPLKAINVNDLYFSGQQSSENTDGGYGSNKPKNNGAFTKDNFPPNWCWNDYSGDYEFGATTKDFFMPGFYGWRDFSAACDQLPPSPDPYTQVINRWDVMVGSWGWPRPDYRMSADADMIDAGNANYGPSAFLGDTKSGGGLLSCWFYTEDRYSNMICTGTLDNDCILLASLKFSMLKVSGIEQTQLSILTHHAFGIDHPYMGGMGRCRDDIMPGTARLAYTGKTDPATGYPVYQNFVFPGNNMLRAFTIVPYTGDPTGLAVMSDADLGIHVDGTPVDLSLTSTAGTVFPRCFDVAYRLRGPISGKTWNFALRVYCRGNQE